MIEFGKVVKDQITGFSGIVTGKCSYITGCDQHLVQPKVSSDGDFKEARWFDEGRLIVVSDGINQADVLAEDNGPDVPAPVK